jgi:hypothetical protein
MYRSRIETPWSVATKALPYSRFATMQGSAASDEMVVCATSARGMGAASGWMKW